MITAAEAGADYVAFGAFFPSMTKAAKHHADPELLRDWNETTVVPCCAIGVITQENCGTLVEAPQTSSPSSAPSGPTPEAHGPPSPNSTRCPPGMAAPSP